MPTTHPEHRQFLAALSQAQRQALTAKSDRVGLTRLAQHWGVIALLFSLITLKVTYWPLLIWPLGVLLVFQFTLLHETVHYTPFATRHLNEFVAYCCGFILCIPPLWFRYFHLEHHRYTQIPGKDPELATPKPQTPRAYLLHISGLPLWWNALQLLFTHARGQLDAPYVPVAKHAALVREASLMLAGYLCLLLLALVLSSAILLYGWLLPLLLGQPLLRLYLMAEHTDCAHTNNMLANTRTTHTNAAVRWLAWNMPYHTEHHSYPAVPFFRLPQLHELLHQHLQVTAQGYRRCQLGFIKRLRRLHATA